MASELKKVISLISRTGDRCIVVDAEGNPSYVIMGLGQYQQLVERKTDVSGMTEQELMDKINQDIAEWKTAQDDTETLAEATEEEMQEIGELEPKNEPEYEEKPTATIDQPGTEDKYYFEPIE